MKTYKIARIATICFAAFALFTGCGKKTAEKNSPETTATEQASEPSKTPETSADPVEPYGDAAMKLAPEEERPDPTKIADYGTPEEGAMRVMTLANAYGDLYYVDVNVGTFFTAPIPEDLADADGNPLTPEDIKPGCVVDIYGDDIMLESYPGQYPGTTKMVLVKRGTEEDAAPYQYLVDEVFTPVDPAEPPFMNAQYRTDLAETTVMLTRGNYEWSYTDETGEPRNVVACGSHILAWPDMIDIRLNESDSLELTLFSSYKPQSVTVTRFPLELWNQGEVPENEAETAENEAETAKEAVEVHEAEEGYTMTAKAGYVYLVEAKWEEGLVEFGFYTE